MTDNLPAKTGETLPATADPMSALFAAIDRGLDAETIERMSALVERHEDRQAARAFADALARFQDECPPIRKTQTAEIASRTGRSYSYTFAPLDEIVRTTRPFLTAHGFAVSWDTAFDAGMMTVTCTLRHVLGHHASATFTAPTESSAGMNPAQKHGAAVTFAKRYSLISVLGLVTEDAADTDAVDPTPIDEHQLADLEVLIEDVGAHRGKFLDYLGIKCLSDLPAERFAGAVQALERKRKTS